VTSGSSPPGSRIKTKKSQVWWSILVIPAAHEVKAGESWDQASLGKISRRTYLKNKIQTKGLGGAAQMAEHLPSTYEALG
jgi:hypothetical protein